MNGEALHQLCESYRRPQRGFFTHTRAETWPNGLFIGNGIVGAAVIGQPQKECLIVCHEELFLPLFERKPVLSMAGFLPEIRGLIDEGRYDDAMQLVIDRAVEAGYPADFIMTDPSHPAFDLLLDFGPYAEVTEYLRSVNFASGEAAIQFTAGGDVRHLRRSFVSRRDEVLVLEIRAEQPISFDLNLGTRPFTLEAWEPGRTSSGNVPKGQFFQRGIGAVARGVADGDLFYQGSYALGSGGYAGVCRAITAGGTKEGCGAGLQVREAESALILVAVEAVDDPVEAAVPWLQSRLDGLPATYDELLERHVPIHGGLFERVKLDLGAGADLPVEDQIDLARREAPSPEYMARLFDACRYLVICSSGRLPPNLQGVWSCTWTPHWSGDYTLDANVQAAVAHLFNCGVPELMTALFDLMDRFLDDFRENARQLYGAEGIFLNSRVSTTGLQQRYNNCPVYFWTAGAAWIAHYYWEYYLYTGDESFLAERAVPFMKEAALFFRDFLEEDESGQYRFCPSWSPENHAANTGSPIAINATMDIAACRELLTNLIAASELTGVDVALIPTWREMVSKLPPYMENEDGALKEWSSPLFEDRYTHRHMSHLYPLYPGREADADADPALFRRVRRAVEKRLEHYDAEEFGAFGLYHAAIAASRCGDGAHAWEALSYLARWHVYSGMGTAHNSGPEVFNVDMAGGFPAAVIELLVNASPTQIRLLPAVPATWPQGSIAGVRCPGRIEIERLSWDLTERRVRLELEAAADVEVAVVLPDGVRTQVCLAAGQTTDLDLHWVESIPP